MSLGLAALDFSIHQSAQSHHSLILRVSHKGRYLVFKSYDLMVLKYMYGETQLVIPTFTDNGNS